MTSFLLRDGSWIEAWFLGVAVAAVLVYNGYDLLALRAVALPVPTLLALLTGLATFVPIVVGKLVYLTDGDYLLRSAARPDASLAYPVAFLLVSFLLVVRRPAAQARPPGPRRQGRTGLRRRGDPHRLRPDRRGRGE